MGPNTTFALAFTPSPTTSLQLYLNGLRMDQGWITRSRVDDYVRLASVPQSGRLAAGELPLCQSEQSSGIADHAASGLQRGGNFDVEHFVDQPGDLYVSGGVAEHGRPDRGAVPVLSYRDIDRLYAASIVWWNAGAFQRRLRRPIQRSPERLEFCDQFVNAALERAELGQQPGVRDRRWLGDREYGAECDDRVPGTDGRIDQRHGVSK